VIILNFKIRHDLDQTAICHSSEDVFLANKMFQTLRGSMVETKKQFVIIISPKENKTG
jgi:hypothetical protein